MRKSAGTTTRSFATIGFLAIVAVVGALVYLFGGFYDVSARPPDTGIVAWSLQNIRDASIRRHAAENPPFPLDDPKVVAAGARAFARLGCANCHGGPGVKWALFSEGLRPDPPDLEDVARDTTPGEIFWAVKNGIATTGMPSFARVGANDAEIWSIAAFVKMLPSISSAEYERWTAPPASVRVAPLPPAPGRTKAAPPQAPAAAATHS